MDSMVKSIFFEESTTKWPVVNQPPHTTYTARQWRWLSEDIARTVHLIVLENQELNSTLCLNAITSDTY